MIPKFYAGQLVRASDLNALGEEIRKNEITKFNGGTFQRNSGGTSLTIVGAASGGGGGGGGGTTGLYHPFEVIDGYPSENGGVVVRVNGASYLTDIESQLNIPINGLGAVPGSTEDDENDQGQFSLPLRNQYIYLEVEVNQSTVVSATIRQGNVRAAGNWENFPDLIEFETEGTFRRAKYSRIAIAHIQKSTDLEAYGKSYALPAGEGQTPETLVIRQIVRTNLGIQYGIIQGRVVPMIVPYHSSPYFEDPSSQG
jgi:hypothetical protein